MRAVFLRVLVVLVVLGVMGGLLVTTRVPAVTTGVRLDVAESVQTTDTYGGRDHGGDAARSEDLSPAGDPLSPEQVALLQPGDFILRRGRGVVSRLIVGVLGGNAGFSHSGVLIHDARGEWMVIHSVSRALADRDGVQAEPLRSFVRNSVPDSTTVVRVRVSEAERGKVVQVAEELLARGAPFDTLFRLDNGAIYCSELLWRTLPENIRNGTTVFRTPGNIIRFESFLDPRFFELVLDRRG